MGNSRKVFLTRNSAAYGKSPTSSLSSLSLAGELPVPVEVPVLNIGSVKDLFSIRGC